MHQQWTRNAAVSPSALERSRGALHWFRCWRTHRPPPRRSTECCCRIGSCLHDSPLTTHGKCAPWRLQKGVDDRNVILLDNNVKGGIVARPSGSNPWSEGLPTEAGVRPPSLGCSSTSGPADKYNGVSSGRISCDVKRLLWRCVVSRCSPRSLLAVGDTI